MCACAPTGVGCGYFSVCLRAVQKFAVAVARGGHGREFAGLARG